MCPCGGTRQLCQGHEILKIRSSINNQYNTKMYIILGISFLGGGEGEGKKLCFSAGNLGLGELKMTSGTGE
jgi:hypothetical protein